MCVASEFPGSSCVPVALRACPSRATPVVWGIGFQPAPLKFISDAGYLYTGGACFGVGLVYELLLALVAGSPLLCVSCGAGSWVDGAGGCGSCSHQREGSWGDLQALFQVSGS